MQWCKVLVSKVDCDRGSRHHHRPIGETIINGEWVGRGSICRIGSNGNHRLSFVVVKNGSTPRHGGVGKWGWGRGNQIPDDKIHRSSTNFPPSGGVKKTVCPLKTDREREAGMTSKERHKEDDEIQTEDIYCLLVICQNGGTVPV